MRAEAGLRKRIRAALRVAYPTALVVGQPASAWTGQGRSDLYVLYAGCYVALEIKVGRGKPTPKQIEWLTAVRMAGGWGYVVRSNEAAVAAVNYAFRGGNNMAGDFDFLFGDDAPAATIEAPTQDGGSNGVPIAGSAEEVDDITAFLGSASPEEAASQSTAALPVSTEETAARVIHIPSDGQIAGAATSAELAGLLTKTSDALEILSGVMIRMRVRFQELDPAAPKRRASAKTPKS